MGLVAGFNGVTDFSWHGFMKSCEAAFSLFLQPQISFLDTESMVNILIYTTRICPYCVMAKRLLDRKGVTYTEINVEDTAAREELIAKTKRMTVPQIYIGDLHVGGFDELYALEKQKKLDSLLHDGN